MPNIDLLVAELLYPDGEAQIAISTENQRAVARLVAQPLANLPARDPRIQTDATYLVTGGLGMLGQSVTRWLISKGAKHVVLTGRKANAEAAEQLAGMASSSGATVRVLAADISREEEVAALIQTISREMPPLKGVVHSAGVLDDGILAQLHWDRFSRVFEPKVYGSWLLHEHTKSLELDFFVLQSSVLSLLGSAGQANYSAGNAFLDSLAAHRRAAGLPATTINWSAWSGGGLAARSGARGEAMWSGLGVEFILPDLGIDAFDKVMHHDVGQVAIAIADWPTYGRKVGASRFLSDLVSGNEKFVSAEFAWRQDRPAHPPPGDGDPRKHLLTRLQQRMTAELGFADPIDLDRPLNEVGLDSLRSVTLANDLEDEFGVLVLISDLISGPTINELADHLCDLIRKDEVPKSDSARIQAAAIGELQENSRTSPAAVNLSAGFEAVDDPHSLPLESRSANDCLLNGAGLHRAVVIDDETAIPLGENECRPQDDCAVKLDKRESARNETKNLDPAGFLPALPSIPRVTGKWLIAPRAKPDARARLFCFPYAGGGLVSFRPWAHLFDDAVEVVAVEAPGRGTRINEAAVEDIDAFVEGLLPELSHWLDRPAAFFGHCLGGLTMFATLCGLSKELHFIKYAFACGVRPPHLLKRKEEFEDNLAYDMMLHRDFDPRLPPYAQTDEIFADIIRQFGMPAANEMLAIPKLRQALLPTIRAEFGMAFNYEYRPIELFSFPISSFVGDSDPWVSEKDSADWGKLTRGRFTNHVRKGSHFLMADDGQYILETIQNEFVSLIAQETPDRTN
jgi:surfactin synthase thioesterase subunit/NAD(P)-dependent dehydrogenase (short-subunit alcohol dehydrogenase family)/acyl carrier protein